MEDNEPESQSLSLQVQGRAQWARELSGSCKEGSQGPGGQQGRQSPQSSSAEPPVAHAKEDECGVEQYSGVWRSGVSAVVWSLPQLYLESGGLHPSGSFQKNILVPLMPTVEFAQKHIYGWSRSADTATLTTWADVLDVSPCQVFLLVGSFPLSGLTGSHLG